MAINWFDGISLKEECAICGYTVGEHHAMLTAECPVFDASGQWADWSLNFRFKLKAQEVGAPIDPNAECKCGIQRNQCEYHRDT